LPLTVAINFFANPGTGMAASNFVFSHSPAILPSTVSFHEQLKRNLRNDKGEGGGGRRGV
jgi:hypothetical protein